MDRNESTHNRSHIDISKEPDGDFFIDKDGNCSPTPERIERMKKEIKLSNEGKKENDKPAAPKEIKEIDVDDETAEK